MNSASRLIWSQVIWRQWRAEPKVPLILMLILSLGVAVFLSIRLANRAAVTGFSLFTESISGGSDLLVRHRAGSFSDKSLIQLRQTVGNLPAAIFPVLDTTAATGPEANSSVYRIIGTDFVALPNAIYLSEQQSTSPLESVGEGFTGMLGQANQVFVSDQSGLTKGQQIDLYIEGGKQSVTVAGVLQPDPLRPEIPANLLVLDLPGAQKLTGLPGKLSRLEIRIPPGPAYKANLDLARQRIEQWANDQFVVETPGQRKDSATQMSAAFRLNLTILSTLALIVGAYLILQAMEASVIKRRSEIAILRCLGVTPSQIKMAWLGESVILGICGSLLGVLIGFLLAQGMVRGISATVNTLYYETTSKSAGFDVGEAALAFGFGLLVSLVAGWLPAREAGSVSPAHAASSGRLGGGLRLLQKPLLGVILVGLALIGSQLPPYINKVGDRIPIGGYAAALFFLLGISVLGGCLFPLVSRFLVSKRKQPQRSYAASQFRMPEGRHRLAAAGLLAAFGMSAAMGILVASFEGTLTGWIQQMLKADVYIASAGAQTVVSESKIPEEKWQQMLKTPGIDGFDRLRRYTIDFRGDESWLGGTDYNNTGRHLQLIWIDPPKLDGPDSLEQIIDGRYPAWVSEAFFRKYKLGRGDHFEVPTPQGEKPIVIAGVYADYGSERGTILCHRRYTSDWFADSALNNLAIYLKQEVDEEKWVADFARDYPGIIAQTNRALRDDALRLFKQTFSVTYALEAIAVVIAVAGLGLAMVGLLLERREELQTLKELGMDRKSIAGAAMWEGIGLSLVGVVGGVILSLILGWLLVYVINVQSFGWTLKFRVPWLSFLALSMALIATGAVVSWLVGFKIANLQSDVELSSVEG